MKVFDERAVRVLATIVVFIAAGVFIYGARHVLIAFVFAILFAYVLDPWVSRMEKWRRLSRTSRTIATLEVYAILVIAIAVAIVFFGNSIIGEGRTLAMDLPSLFQKVRSGEIAQEIGSEHGWSLRSQIELQNFLSQHGGAVLSWIGSLASQIAQMLSNLFWIVLIPILAFFFLKDGGKFVVYTLDFAKPAARRAFLEDVLTDLNEMTAQYVRVQLILAVLALVFYMGVLSLLHVPYGLILGAIAGVLEFLPTIGPALGAIVILGVAFLAGYDHIFIVALVLGIWRITQDYVTFPRITGAKLKLHPLAAIFAIMVGFELGGVAGAYLSIPIMAGVRIVRKRWKRTHPEEQLVS